MATTSTVDVQESGAPSEFGRPSPPNRWAPVVLVASVVAVVVLIGGTLLLAPGSDDDAVETEAAGDAGADATAAAPTPTGGQEESSDAAASDDSHHHADSTITYDELPRETRAQVDQVIAEWATRYPTAADATAAGWFKATPSLYGIGSHYIHDANGFSVAQPFDLLNPNI